MADEEIFNNYHIYDNETLKDLANERGLHLNFNEDYVEALEKLDKDIDTVMILTNFEEGELRTFIGYYVDYLRRLGFRPEILPENMFQVTQEDREGLVEKIHNYKNGTLDPDLLTEDGKHIYVYAQVRINQHQEKPVPEEVIEVNYEDRVRGMLYGVALGDALGAPHEFKNSIPATQYTGQLEYQPLVPSRFQGIRYGVPGQVTDDTEMTLALANTILAEKGFKRDNVIRAYQDWANSKPFGMGKNTRRLFHGVKTIRGFNQRYEKALREDLTATQSNGSLMRASPLALLVNPDDPDSFAPVLEDTRLSNPNRVNEEASLIYTMTLALALRGTDVDTILDNVTEAAAQMNSSIQEAVEQVNQGFARNLNAVGKGWVVHGLYAALMSLRYYQLAEENPFKTALDQIIRLGGDTDTNGAIAGGLLGALAGYQEIKHEEGDNLTILINADPSQGDFPRPEIYLPRTIDDLARKLAQEFPLKEEEEEKELVIDDDLPGWLWDWAQAEGITGHIVEYYPSESPGKLPIVLIVERNQDTWLEVEGAEKYNPDLR